MANNGRHPQVDWLLGNQGPVDKNNMEYNEIKNEAANVIKAFRIPTPDRDKMKLLVKLAKRHARLAETLSVKTKLSDKQISELREIESQIIELSESVGLIANFEIRPNGWTVRLWDKQKTIFNYYGGSSNGYGVGKP